MAGKFAPSPVTRAVTKRRSSPLTAPRWSLPTPTTKHLSSRLSRYNFTPITHVPRAHVSKGANVIFSVTNFWEHLFTGNTPDQSGAKEAEQARKLARAASQTSSLEHYVFSTLPSAKAATNGKYPVPHLDHKGEVNDWLKSELPALHAKTTYVVLGFYPNNFVSFPNLKPFELVSHIPCSPVL